MLTSEIKEKFDFSLVIPAYNEAGRIGPTLKDIIFTLDNFDAKYELVIVMDGCNDGTFEKVKNITGKNPSVNMMVFPKRLGKGGAIKEALKRAKGDIIAFIDADGAIPSGELNRLVKLAQDFDLVIGSRYSRDSNLLCKRSLKRLILSKSFNILVKIIFREMSKISDTQCGVKVFKRQLANTIIDDLLIADFAFDVNLIYSALRCGFKVKEVGVTWSEKEDGKLSHGIKKQAFAMMLSLIKLKLYYQFRGAYNSKFLGKMIKSLYLWLRY